MQEKNSETDSQLQDTSERPIIAGLVKVRNEKIAILARLVTALKEKLPTNEAKAKAAMCAELAGEINELCDWIFPPREPLSFNEALDFAQNMRDLGMPEEHVRWSLGVAQKRERGRPAIMRQASIRALEIKLAHQSKSWMYLATELCPCDKGEHDFQCREKLRQAVLDLKAFLTKYDIPI